MRLVPALLLGGLLGAAPCVATEAFARPAQQSAPVAPTVRGKGTTEATPDTKGGAAKRTAQDGKRPADAAKGKGDSAREPKASRNDQRASGKRAGKPGSQEPAEPKHDQAEAKAPKGSARSLGAPNQGRLEGGTLLRPSKTVHVAKGTNNWGLPQLVRAVRRAADAVVTKYKGPPMFVGDLSTKGGGPLLPHRSHQSGRDVDIGYYAVDGKNRPVLLDRFVAFDAAGRARDGSGLRFDAPRNWGMIRALLENPEIEVRYLFITAGLEKLIVEHAERKHARRELVARAATAMQNPDDVIPHDDHVHVRIGCPKGGRGGCIEESISLPSDPGSSGPGWARAPRELYRAPEAPEAPEPSEPELARGTLDGLRPAGPLLAAPPAPTGTSSAW